MVVSLHYSIRTKYGALLSSGLMIYLLKLVGKVKVTVTKQPGNQS